MVCIESAHGRFLCAEPDGKVVADRRWDDSWEHFRVESCDAPVRVVMMLVLVQVCV